MSIMSKKMKTVVLIAEDKHILRKAIAKNFDAEGYKVLEAADGEEALKKARRPSIDILILDIMMPKMNGYDVLKTLRKEKNELPVIILTARGTIDDKIDGFDSGADDYVVKPFSIDVLFKRVEAILRRRSPVAKKIVEIGDWKFDFERWTAFLKKENIKFLQRELEMLELLIQKDGKPVSRDEFLDRFWSPETYPTNRTIDTHILDIRKKLAKGKGIEIETQHRVGYKVVIRD